MRYFSGKTRSLYWALLLIGFVTLSALLRDFAPANSVLLVIVGAAISAWGARRIGGAFLVRVVLTSYFLVVLLAVALYAVSALRLPLFTESQLGDGFWTFAWDARSYDAVARQIMESWVTSAQFPAREHLEYFIFIALIYFLFGPYPLNAILVNAVFHSLAVLGAFSLGRRLGDTPVARMSGLLVAFWPSLLFWSAQLLKDTLLLVFILLLLNVIATGLDGQALRARASHITWWIWLFLLVLLTYRFRWYLILFFTISLVATVVIVAAFFGLRRGAVGWGAVLLFAILVSAGVGARIDLQGLAAPARPETSQKRNPTIKPESSATAEGTEQLFLPLTDDRSLARIVLPGLKDPIKGLNDVRRGSVRAGGTLVDPDVQFENLWDVIVYFPRGLTHVLLSPYPTEWFHTGGSTGAFKTLASAEAVMIYVLLAPLLIGSVLAAKSGRAGLVLLFTYVWICASAIALAIANLGTLFRLRLEFLMPGIVLVAVGIEQIRHKVAARKTAA